jgi:hypothetical protein
LSRGRAGSPGSWAPTAPARPPPCVPCSGWLSWTPARCGGGGRPSPLRSGPGSATCQRSGGSIPGCGCGSSCCTWASCVDGRPGRGAGSGQRWLLLRRNRTSGELAYYRCFMPHPVPLATLVKVAGRRWSIEERIKTSKGLCGLDQHQVRRWRSWYRWAGLWPLGARAVRLYRPHLRRVIMQVRDRREEGAR